MRCCDWSRAFALAVISLVALSIPRAAGGGELTGLERE
jgi:hypothetical protein